MIEVAVAFAAAEAAVAGVKRAIALGKEIQECYHDISTFFEKQAEIKSVAVVDSVAKKNPNITLSQATKQALDATFASRKLYRLEVELREMLIYNNSEETGLYQEMCARRDAIVAAAKEEAEEEARIERMRIREIARKRAEKIQLIQSIIAAIVGTACATAILYGIWWMFHWRE
jgi:glycerol uptake facilitator-like aquaporin